MENTLTKYSNIAIILVFFFGLFLFSNCGGNEDPEEPPVDNTPKVVMDPSITYQEMIGFGAAMTWYCDRVTSSSKRDEIIDLIVDDLELDIVRLKNWYYPENYPVNKVPDQMEITWFKQHFDATNELFDLLKLKDPDLKILFSSWGPPSSLKSNGMLQEGTLKKENEIFMYDQYATYWEDVLDHITFVPDYLSIQNEPSFVTDGWETCEWRPTETPNFPGYDIAFDKVYEKIKDRNVVPKLIGPESANLGSSSFGNTFSTFADRLKDKPVELYAYHPYNFNDGSVENEINSALQMIRDDYSDKPNLMTEYSGMSWYKNAEFIYSTLSEANSSGYIYWELIWDSGNDKTMIKIAQNGDYELSPFYYQIKHFAKSIHRGDYRIDLTINNSPVKAVAFVNPGYNRVAVIILNPLSISLDINLEVEDKAASLVGVWQSTEGNLYKELTGLSIDQKLNVPSESLTTIELEL